MKGCLLIVITLYLFGCGKEGPGPVTPTPDSPVHLAGTVLNSAGGSVASYWKNGVYTDLTNDSTSSVINSMCVDGSSVLIGGYNSNNSGVQDMIWQNGKETVIDGGYPGVTLIASHDNNLFGVWDLPPVGWVLYKNFSITPINGTGWPTAMALLGDDAYIVGASEGNDYSADSTFYYRDTYALCWKNEQVIFRDTVLSYATCIFIHQNDVYMGGYLSRYDEATNRIACYWKNGQRVNLTDGDHDAMVTSLFVTDTNVYASGTVNDQALYWKDGVATALSTGAAKAGANSIVVQGTDVHVGGYDDGHPAYWKNNVKQNISNQNKRGQINFVAVGSN